MPEIYPTLMILADGWSVYGDQDMDIDLVRNNKNFKEKEEFGRN